jgi:4,5-DOPA dioxygenase extradiol
MTDPFACQAGQAVPPTPTDARFPSIFISHGAPTLVLEESRARAFLRHLGSKLGKPRAVVVISAHWIAPEFRVTNAPRLQPEYDFTGFPDELYRVEYAPQGAPDVAEYAAELIAAAGLPTALDASSKIDHGSWVPLKLMYPAADVPVTQISLRSRLDPAEHAALGRALLPLRERGVLLLGSGGAVHNMRDWFTPRSGGAPSYETEFAAWIDRELTQGRIASLLDPYREPSGRSAHPSIEHWLPLIVAANASLASKPPRRIFDGSAANEPRMNAYAFE